MILTAVGHLSSQRAAASQGHQRRWNAVIEQVTDGCRGFRMSLRTGQVTIRTTQNINAQIVLCESSCRASRIIALATSRVSRPVTHQDTRKKHLIRPSQPVSRSSSSGNGDGSRNLRPHGNRQRQLIPVDRPAATTNAEVIRQQTCLFRRIRFSCGTYESTFNRYHSAWRSFSSSSS